KLAFEIRDQGGLDGIELSFLRSYRYARSGLAAAAQIKRDVLSQGA
ncbi:MAG: hypothetical protein H7290_05630, partial [Flavobacterium sp.]|nr:hypothetical protein [Aeromicrobium sp.]